MIVCRCWEEGGQRNEDGGRRFLGDGGWDGGGGGRAPYVVVDSRNGEERKKSELVTKLRRFVRGLYYVSGLDSVMARKEGGYRSGIHI